jgi:hypothetical protein
MDFKTFLRVAEHIINPFEDPEANFPIMIRGRHGIGKSEVVYQLADKLGLKVVERRVSQMMEGDLMGLPSTDGDCTRWNHPDWYKECHYHARLLFFDEVDRGDPQIRQGIMEIGDSRKFNGLKLHPNTIIVAAVNGGKHGSEYQVGEMDPAESDRWTVYDVEPSVEDWLDWAKDKVHRVMWDFVNQNRDHLEHNDSFQPDEIYPSRRSIVRLDKVLERAGLYFKAKENLDLILHMATGFIGFGAAAAFQEFVANYEFQMTVEDIVDRGRYEETKEWGVNEHLAMSKKISNSGVLEAKLDQSQLTNLANYFVTLPSEAAASFWVLFCGKEEDDFQNPNMIDFNRTTTYNGKMVAEYYGSILTGTVLDDTP